MDKNWQTEHNLGINEYNLRIVNNISIKFDGILFHKQETNCYYFNPSLATGGKYC